MDLMTCQTYREFIQFKLKENFSNRGYKTRLARALKVQASYFSHILSGAAELSLDQASALCDFWHLNARNSEYFITLVSHSRAGTDSLRQRLANQLEAIRKKGDFNPSIQFAGVEMEFESSITYFSQWFHCAIHAALNVESLRTAEKLARRFQLPVGVVERSLAFLAESGLVQQVNGEWQVLKPTLSTAQPLLKDLFYRESRRKAQEMARLDTPDSVHFSMLCTISQSEYEKLTAKIREFKLAAVEAVAENEEEDVAYLLIDWFRLGRR